MRFEEWELKNGQPMSWGKKQLWIAAQKAMRDRVESAITKYLSLWNPVRDLTEHGKVVASRELLEAIRDLPIE